MVWPFNKNFRLIYIMIKPPEKMYWNTIVYLHKPENSIELGNPPNVKAKTTFSFVFRSLQLLLMSEKSWSKAQGVLLHLCWDNWDSYMYY